MKLTILLNYYPDYWFTTQGDQIASLYDLLDFKDKPVSESIVPNNTRPTHAAAWGRASGLRRHPSAFV